ncbi:MAG: DMT family transporter, partial [Burkholderiaceae bacterium]
LDLRKRHTGAQLDIAMDVDFDSHRTAPDDFECYRPDALVDVAGVTAFSRDRGLVYLDRASTECAAPAISACTRCACNSTMRLVISPRYLSFALGQPVRIFSRALAQYRPPRLSHLVFIGVQAALTRFRALHPTRRAVLMVLVRGHVLLDAGDDGQVSERFLSGARSGVDSLHRSRPVDADLLGAAPGLVAGADSPTGWADPAGKLAARLDAVQFRCTGFSAAGGSQSHQLRFSATRSAVCRVVVERTGRFVEMDRGNDRFPGHALFIIRPGSNMLSPAVLLALGTALCYSLYQIMTRKVSEDQDPMTTLFYSAIVGCVGLTVVMPFFWVTPRLMHVPLCLLLGTMGAVGHSCSSKDWRSSALRRYPRSATRNCFG